jgi:hypothetical protein
MDPSQQVRPGTDTHISNQSISTPSTISPSISASPDVDIIDHPDQPDISHTPPKYNHWWPSPGPKPTPEERRTKEAFRKGEKEARKLQQGQLINTTFPGTVIIASDRDSAIATAHSEYPESKATPKR